MENSMIPRLIRMFEEAENASQDARQLAERDRDYKNLKQWTSEEKAALEKRKQPVITFDRIARKVDYLCGLEKQSRKDPKGFPRTPKDEGSSQAATDALRFVCDDTNWDAKRSDAFENVIVEGTGAIMVGVKQGKHGIDPDITQIPWDRLFFDPYSHRLDFSDAQYMGIVTWMDEAEAKAKFPGKDEIIESTIEGSRNYDTYDDKPKWSLWADYRRKRLRVVEGYYLVQGKWHYCIATQAGELVETQLSPYLDEDGQPENPIKAVSYYVDRDNNRYGGVRSMIGPQDEINKRRSKALHLITMRQGRISRGSGLDGDDLKKELAKPDGIVTADKDEFEILPTNDMAAANLQMLQEAKAEIDLLGPNAALAGKNENDMSGRAILAQQQGGMVEVAMLMDRLRHLSLAVYRSMWARIRQYWDGPRWIRVTDDERNLRFVGLNQPMTVEQLAQKVQQGDPQALEDARQFLGQLNPQLAQALDAALQGDQQAGMMIGMFIRDNGQMLVKVENQVAELDVDIVIDEGMDTPTVQAEQFDTLAKVLPTAVNLPPPYLKALIMASSLRDKDQLLEEVEKASQGPQIPPEMQQQLEEMQKGLQQLEQENAALKMDAEGKQADRQIKGAEIELKGREIEQKDAEIKIDAHRAETERLMAMKPEAPQQEAA